MTSQKFYWFGSSFFALYVKRWATASVDPLLFCMLAKLGPLWSPSSNLEIGRQADRLGLTNSLLNSIESRWMQVRTLISIASRRNQAMMHIERSMAQVHESLVWNPANDVVMMSCQRNSHSFFGPQTVCSAYPTMDSGCRVSYRVSPHSCLSFIHLSNSSLSVPNSVGSKITPGPQDAMFLLKSKAIIEVSEVEKVENDVRTSAAWNFRQKGNLLLGDWGDNWFSCEKLFSISSLEPTILAMEI